MGVIDMLKTSICACSLTIIIQSITYIIRIYFKNPKDLDRINTSILTSLSCPIEIIHWYSKEKTNRYFMMKIFINPLF